MEDLVTICIPVYNGERYLKECIQASVKQTYSNIEILLVNDCSTDGSRALIEQFQLQDSRIRLINNPKNLGLVGNWAQCLEQAKGNWIKFLFQDDYMQLDCVEKMYNACKAHSVKMSICSRTLLFDDNASAEAVGYFQKNNYTLADVFPQSKLVQANDAASLFAKHAFYNVVGEPIVTFFHKSLLQACGGYNADLVQMVDYEFTVRTALAGGFSFLREELVTFRVHFGATSNTDTLSTEKKMKRHFLEPVIMYHEYLFNPRFKLLRQHWPFSKQLLNAARFYGAFIGKYKNEQALISATLHRYSKFNYIKLLSLPWQWMQKVKN